MDAPVSIPWGSSIQLLSNDKNWPIRTLDTVFASSASPSDIRWYFTNKSGSISKKKKDGTSLDKISDRFSRFALSNPFNTDGLVGVLIDGNGGRRVLQQTDLSQLLGSDIHQLTQIGSFLQVYLRPIRGENVIVQSESVRSPSGTYTHSISTDTGSTTTTNSNIVAQIENISTSITGCLQANHGQQVEQLKVEYIVDDNEHVWLSRIQQCTVTANDMKSDQPAPAAAADGEPAPPPINAALHEDVPTTAVVEKGSIETKASSISNSGNSRLGDVDTSFSPTGDSQHRDLLSTSPPVAAAAIAPSKSEPIPSPQQLQLAQKLLLEQQQKQQAQEIAAAASTAIAAAASVPVLAPVTVTSRFDYRTPAEHEQPTGEGTTSTAREESGVGEAAATTVSREEDSPSSSSSSQQQEQQQQQQQQQREEQGRYEEEVEGDDGDIGAEAARATTGINTAAAAAAAAAVSGGDLLVESDGERAQMHSPKKKNPLQQQQKKNKKKNKISGSKSANAAGFRRSLLDEPPSVELMAKFAAEKERALATVADATSSSQQRTSKKVGGGGTGRAVKTNSLRRSQSGNSRASASSQQQLSPLAAKQPKQTQFYPDHDGGNAPAAAAVAGKDSLSIAERRLEELQKLAATTAQIKALSQQQQMGGSMGALGGLAAHRMPLGAGAAGAGAAAVGSSSSAAAVAAAGVGIGGGGYRPSMSGSEAEFLSRQINTAEAGNLSMFSQMEDLDPNLAAGLDGGGFGSAILASGAGAEGGGVGLLNTGSLVLGGDSVWSVDAGPTPSAAATVAAIGGGPISQQPQQQQPQSSFASAARGLGGGGGSVTAVMNDALRDRIGGLEKQIQTLSATLERKEVEMSKKDEKIQKLHADVETSKRSAAAELLKMKEKHHLQLLKMTEQHDREKSAIILGRPADAAAAAASTTTVEGSSGSSLDITQSNAAPDSSQSAAAKSAHEANSKLIQQVEYLRAEQRRLNDTHADDRRTLIAETNSKLIAQEKILKAEIMDLKSTQAALEDQLTKSGDDMDTAMSQIQSLQAINMQLESAKAKAIETQNRLRSDLKNMEQSVQSSYRLEVAQGIGAGGSTVDPETAIRLSEAKNEAKSRQLTNKLEFLKAQLDTEKKAADDARQASQLMQVKLDEMREDFRMRMLQADSDQKHAVEVAEQRLDEQYQERMRELTTLQMKLNSIQGQLSDAHEQGLLAKQREDDAKGIASRASAHQAALKVELEQLRGQVQQLREEKEDALLKETGKQSQESVIRRLDNERQYLKSQLASEITHKNELQNTLMQSQQQLSEVQKQWNQDVNTLKDTQTAAAQEFAEKEQHYAQKQAQLDSELDRNRMQNRELKEGFVKMRDQVRMEQLALENANTAHRRLQEAYEEAQANVVRLKQQEEETAEIHRAQMDAINETVRQQEARNQAITSSLREELSNQYLTNSHSQTLMIELKDGFAVEKVKLGQSAGMMRIINVLRRWKTSRMALGFRQWHNNSTLMGAAKQFREQVEGILKKTSKELHKDKVAALDKLRADLSAQHEEALQSKQQAWQEAMDSALIEAEEAKMKALEDAAQEHAEALRQAENDFQFDLAAARREGEEAVNHAIARKDLQIEKINQFHKEHADYVAKEAQERLEDALIVKEQEMTALMQTELETQKKSMLETRRQLLEQAALNLDKKLREQEQQLSKKHATAIAQLQALHQADRDTTAAEHARAMQELQEEKAQALADQQAQLLAEAEQQKSQLRSEMLEAEEARIRNLRSVWQEEFEAKAAQMASEFEVQLSGKMEEYAKNMESERQRSVKIEASKWKQALKDASQNHALESVKTKAEVANEKDQEMKLELEKLARKFESQRQDEMAAHREEMLQLHKDHAVALERQSATDKKETDRLLAVLEIDLKKQHDMEWKAVLDKELSAAEGKWKNKLDRETARLEQLKDDFAQQSEHFAEERSNLQRQVNSADDRILQIEEMHKAEMVEQRKTAFEQQEELEKSFEEEKERLAEKHGEHVKEVIREVESRCKTRYDEDLSGESSRMHGELEKQVGQMQEESEKLISGLEQAMGNLKNEKSALNSELESLATRLEETEDSLYDEQQQLKKVKLEASLNTWRFSTKMFQMKQRFQGKMAEFDAEATRRYAEIKKDMQAQIDQVTLLGMKLAALLQQSDATRLDLHSILTNHRTSELIQNRNKIQVMEKDLERLTMEKDSLDEQKELIEGDIQQMEAQVRDIEDQIRAHNQESSMQNGRINVAHARKKRRLDTELEHLLEAIEQKRHTMTQMDRRVTEKGHERDNVEMDMIDIERKLVEILLEQQKLVLGRVDEGKMIIDQTQVVLSVGKIEFPVPAEPTLDNAMTMLARRRKREESKKRREEEVEMDDNSWMPGHQKHHHEQPQSQQSRQSQLDYGAEDDEHEEASKSLYMRKKL